jgi:hydrogenase nickel incorporation protein HypB
MIRGNAFKMRRYFHHKDFDKPRHSHVNRSQVDVSTQKSGTREIKVVRRVLDVNEKMAEQNRRLFAEKGLFVLNVMSSPGSGKTTTLQKTLARIMPEIRSAVIVGDICTTHDADRLADTGAPVVQINTDAEFDIGEDSRVVVLSVTEGEDKPVKYPLMFRECEAALLNKVDLLPYLDFEKEKAVDYIHQVHPEMPVFEISAKTEEGFEPWIEWLKGKIKEKI